MPQIAKTSVKLDRENYKKLQIWCIENDVGISQALNMAMWEFLDRRKSVLTPDSNKKNVKRTTKQQQQQQQ